ncbi:signal peptide peptidase-like 2B isoform X1 [Asterias rubens]|uniref:signal peptide peptidase-like 2B isoform X1 n=1 Tax=Asterias rubens TaxID=7604 RepID=UPI0014555EC2|nr:signal peptide peptidase-like 2B isoform X1 [Asterias rubens]
MAFLLLCFVSLIIVPGVPVVADLGILSARITGENGVKSTKEYCIAYGGNQVNLPKEPKDLYPLVDLGQSKLCTSPKDASKLSGAVVEALRGNCTFLEKGLFAQGAGARSLLVVTATKITTPDLNDSTELKIPVALLAASDHKDIWVNGGQVQAALYDPEHPSFDYNLIVIWFMAVFTVVVGGYWSGMTAHRIAIKKKRLAEGGESDRDVEGEEDSDSDAESEDEMPLTITLPIVVVWVIMIMVMLLLLFFFYDYMVYVVITFYCLGASNGLHACLYPILKRIMPCKIRLPVNKIPFLSSRPYVYSVILAFACIGCVVCWFVFRHETFAWILLDLLGIAFCISILKLIHMPNFKICVILLSLLFFYDIFFVFITPLFTQSGESVMIKAATGGSGATEQIPVLLQVPRITHSTAKICGTYSMLGFGDILIPGLLVGYCCSFDFKIHSRVKVYYIASCVAYAVGLIITFVALAVMQTGQPALLYLVPCTVLTTLVLAAFRRELSDIWHARKSSTQTRSDGSFSVNTTEPTSSPTPQHPAGDEFLGGSSSPDPSGTLPSDDAAARDSGQDGLNPDGRSCHDEGVSETEPLLLPLDKIPNTYID